MSTFESPNDYRNYLAHYGVPGMKWGVRKADAYDNIYYRAKYNKDKLNAFKDYKSGEITKSKFLRKRTGQIAKKYAITPIVKAARSIGRDYRGWYRLLTGKTYRKSNEQEFTPNARRAASVITDKNQRKRLDRMVDESLSNNTTIGGTYAAGSFSPINAQDLTAINNYLDTITLKEIERIEFGKR